MYSKHSSTFFKAVAKFSKTLLLFTKLQNTSSFHGSYYVVYSIPAEGEVCISSIINTFSHFTEYKIQLLNVKKKKYICHGSTISFLVPAEFTHSNKTATAIIGMDSCQALLELRPGKKNKKNSKITNYASLLLM